MKRNRRSRFRPGWAAAWLMQIMAALGIGLAASALHALGGPIYGIALWALVPPLGAWTAFRAVRRGLLNYLAWIAPPACLYAAHYALWRFSPSAGAALLTAFLSLVGAAAGDVLNQRRKKSN